MKKRFSCGLMLAGLLLIGCIRTSAETLPPATFDPRLLTITPAPTITPEATFTPRPTTVRLPSSTPYPTFEPKVTLIPYTLAPTTNATATGRPLTNVPPTATVPIGVSGVGPDRPELAAILTFEPIAYCHQWFLAQIGVINRGTAAAYNFDVEWSFGWGEPQKVHVDELQWYAGPLYFFSGQTAVQCDADTTLTAWIKIDTGNTVNESVEDDNTAQQTYTVKLVTPTP